MKEIFVGMAGGAEACKRAVRDAVKKALWPELLSFGLCCQADAGLGALAEDIKPAKVTALPVPGEEFTLREAWQGVYGQYAGQRHALQITPEATFRQGWDKRLQDALKMADWEKPLLTCVLTADGTPRAVAAKGFSPEGRLQLAPGTRIVNALRPVRAAFLCPDFVFGAGEWMYLAQELNWDGGSALALSLHAFQGGFRAMTLNENLACCAKSYEFLEEDRPEGELAGALKRFEQARGLSFDRLEVCAQGYLGIYTPEMRYPVQLSMAESFRQLLRRRRETPISRVMLATAMEAFPPETPEAAYLAQFANLAALSRFSLCCYCPQELVKRLQKILPNTYFARWERRNPQDGPESSVRQKPLFIAHAARQFPAHTHYGWIDMDYLKHPLYPRSVFLWDKLADNKIHLAQVDGQPDTSLLVVPKGRIGWLSDVSATLIAASEGEMGDTGLFSRLINTYPDQFTLHPMPQRQALLSLCQPLLDTD